MKNKKRNILLIGGGGREHALADKIRKSPLLGKLHMGRGCDAMAKTVGEFGEIVPQAIGTYEQLADYCVEEKIDLVIVGPEVPLVKGIANKIRAVNIPVFGPTQAAAQLEGSKIWMKQILQKYNIPTAKFACFDDADEAKQYVRDEYKNGYASNQGKIVIKTDGLAAGKGVVIAEDLESALTAIDEAVSGKFGDAGKKLVIEEFMAGEEFSYFAISDGSKAQFFGTAQDYKRAYDGDKGLNTGGMGAFSPAKQETDALNQEIDETILQPLVKAMQEEGMPYCGILFFGIMLTAEGAKVIEINIRMGDPECQVILPRLQNDIISLFEQAAQGDLRDEVQLDDSVALTVVMAAKGYPQSYQKGSIIRGLDKAEKISKDGVIYHAGTKLIEGHYHANGGRVLNITAINQKTLAEARNLAYNIINEIDWQEGFYRTDIGE
ncbi:MAG: phosphoribosylamine--glycine ligase [Alphaproteobacteria bacterium]|nr:phosphoribosylamine--glycine ligase [Alphaproteobacteria bacterium]